jgi:phospholipid-binding lipoprotein MlaA
MSLPALTIATLMAAAPVNPGGAPAAVPALIVDVASIAQDAPVANPTGTPVEPPPPVAPPAATEGAPAPEPASPAEAPSPAPNPASPPETASPPLHPAPGQDDIVVTGRARSAGDPLSEINAQSYQVTQKVDEAFVAPVAFAYKDALPRPLRRGVQNFLNNLSEPIVFLNFLLQLKPGKAAETLGRFAINTTIGGAGLVDVAKRKPFKLPYRNNGFANTMGYYGVPPGPYFYLPLIGSTTLRDFIGNRVDQIILPMALGRPFSEPIFVIPAAVLNELGDRIAFDDELRAIRAQRDPYVASREYYLRKRQAEIDALRGHGDSTIHVIVPASPESGLAPAVLLPTPENPSGARFSRH